MAQSWHDVLLAHWPVGPEEMRRLVPHSLPLDLFEGRAWVGIIPFRMTGVRLRGTPALPWLSAFPELNVRTYVSVDGKPGVFFFSLDAANPVVVALARRWYRLPYFLSRMSPRAEGEDVAYVSRRVHRGAPPAEFHGRYRPVGPVFGSGRGSLGHWLTERYCLYTLDHRGRALRAEIHHAPWPLQPAEALIEANTMAAAAGLRLPEGPPLLHFARRVDVVVWPPRQAGVEGGGSR